MSKTDLQRCRARDHLVAAGKLYPEAWKQADAFRAQRERDALPNWPDWCFLPMAGWYAIVSGGGDRRVPFEQIGDVGRLAALGAWRVTQGIYRFDPALFDALVATPVDGDLPHDVLYRLPEWCVYVETPGMTMNDSPMYGFFAHLEWDAGNGRPELRLLLDTEAELTPIPIHLGPWPMSESIARMTDVANLYAMAHARGPLRPESVDIIRTWVEPLCSLLLYLCSQNAEIGADGKRPVNPQPTRTRHGPRLFPADRPTTWDVGVRLGAALRAAYAAKSQEEQETGSSHASPRAHIRRAHWHGYWTGPKDKPEARTLMLKWLPPIAVNLADPGDLPATVRPVRP